MFDVSVTEKLNIYGSQDIEAPLQKYVKALKTTVIQKMHFVAGAAMLSLF